MLRLLVDVKLQLEREDYYIKSMKPEYNIAPLASKSAPASALSCGWVAFLRIN